MNRSIVLLLLIGFHVFAMTDCLAQWDVEALEARGLRVTRSPHLTLITDVRERSDVEEFNAVFEAAISQWCEYFEIPAKAVEGWHLTGVVITDPNQKQAFVDAGLFPRDLPPFPAAFQRGSMFWVYLQDGDYYTRHLLIHEGTHAFMETFLGGLGAPWYAEGMAELLGLHRWTKTDLVMNYQIQNREEVPYWGRVKLIREDRDAGLGKSLDEVLELKVEDFRKVNGYAWAWAACQFLDRHPEYQSQFRMLSNLAKLNPAEFNQRYRKSLSTKKQEAEWQWQNFIEEMEYGYDVVNAVPVAVDSRRSDDNRVQFKLAVNRGWQDTEIDVKVGDRLRIEAEGMFQIKKDGQPWPCDAGGVTIEYYNGRPLGRLTAMIRSPENELSGPFDIGLQKDIKSELAGRLLLRINESPAHWEDNEGVLAITVQALSD